eukprot:1604546-Alexandrium_andersonii.AAC.1
MSASLVGSEMCIRDRKLLGLFFQQNKGFLKLRTLGLPRRALERTARPVSYTHLTLPTICSV